MRLEFVGKTKGKITKVGGYTIKLGQKETLPAAQMRVMATAPNSILDQFSPRMRALLFEKAKGSEKVQKQLDGIEIVSDLPNLTEEGARLGALNWEDEQTGCTFIIDRAIDPIKLKDCKATSFKIVSRDGGSVQVFFTLTTGEIDRETAGDLVLLKNTEILFELAAPQVYQQDLREQDGKDDAGAAATSGTPEQALAASVEGNKPVWPFPHSAHEEKPDVPVTNKKRRKAAAGQAALSAPGR